jgi:hypothetical protein
LAILRNGRRHTREARVDLDGHTISACRINDRPHALVGPELIDPGGLCIGKEGWIPEDIHWLHRHQLYMPVHLAIHPLRGIIAMELRSPDVNQAAAVARHRQRVRQNVVEPGQRPLGEACAPRLVLRLNPFEDRFAFEGAYALVELVVIAYEAPIVVLLAVACVLDQAEPDAAPGCEFDGLVDRYRSAWMSMVVDSPSRIGMPGSTASGDSAVEQDNAAEAASGLDLQFAR